MRTIINKWLGVGGMYLITTLIGSNYNNQTPNQVQVSKKTDIFCLAQVSQTSGQIDRRLNQLKYVATVCICCPFFF